VLKDLDWFFRVDIPNHNNAISAHRQQVRTLWVFGTPIYIKDVLLMIVVPLLKWFRVYQWHSVVKEVLSLHSVVGRDVFDLIDLPNTKNMVFTASGHKFAIFSKFDDPSGAFVALKFDNLL
jgi:hypothetical protein